MPHRPRSDLSAPHRRTPGSDTDVRVRTRSPPSPPTESASRSSPQAAPFSTPSPPPRTAPSPSTGRVPWGSDYYAEHGRMMAADGLEVLKDFDAIYFGAVGWPTVPDHISLWGLRLNITPELRPVGQRPPGALPPRRRLAAAQGRRHPPRLGRRPGEQRGRVRRPRRPQPVGPRPGQRGRHADRAVHREGLRADHPLRLRPGPHPQGQEGHQRHQEQRPAVRHGAVGRDVRPRRAGLPGRRAPRACWSTRCPRSSCSSPRTSRSSSPRTSTPTSCPTWAPLSPAASAWPPAPTTTRSAASRACSSRSTARRRTSRARASPTRSARSLSGALMLEHFGLHEEAARLQKAVDATTGGGVRTRDIGGTATTDDVIDASSSLGPALDDPSSPRSRDAPPAVRPMIPATTHDPLRRKARRTVARIPQ